MVFQNYALFPHMTVADNIKYGLKMRNWTRDESAHRLAEMLDLVGLGGLEQRLPRELSGGQQQRVALARALAFDPSLLVLDEPLGALDRELRIQMASELRRIHATLGTTVLYVTHDREEALSLSDRIAIMRSGQIRAVGTAEELYRRPPSRFVASFFSGHNVVPIQVIATESGRVRVECFGQQLWVPMLGARDLGAGDAKLCLVVPATCLKLRQTRPQDIPINATNLEFLYLGDSLQLSCLVPGLGKLVGKLSADTDAPRERDSPVYADSTKLLVVPDED